MALVVWIRGRENIVCSPVFVNEHIICCFLFIAIKIKMRISIIKDRLLMIARRCSGGGRVLGGSTGTKGFGLAAASGPANPPLNLVSGTLDPMSLAASIADSPLVTVTSAVPSVLESKTVGGVVTGALVSVLLTSARSCDRR